MICYLNSLKKSLKNGCLVTVLGASEPDLQLYLDRWGLSSTKVFAKMGPWGSFILKANQQEIALGPALAQKLQVETL
jgi:hypothetical protein